MTAGLKTGLLATVCILCFGHGLPFAGEEEINLTGAWKDDMGGYYYIRQVGDQVFWNLNTEPSLMTVFHGTIRGNMIRGKWADLPEGKRLGTGILTLKIESNDRLTKSEADELITATVWTRIEEEGGEEALPPSEEGLWVETELKHAGCKDKQDYCQDYKIDVIFKKGAAGLVEADADQWTLKGRFTGLTLTFHIFEFNEYHGNGTLTFTKDFKSFSGEWETLDGHRGTWSGKR